MHHSLIAVDKHGHDVRQRLGLQDQARDAPFEVAQRLERVLMDASFGENVHPAVAAGEVGGGRREDVAAGGCVGEGTVSEGISDRMGVLGFES